MTAAANNPTFFSSISPYWIQKPLPSISTFPVVQSRFVKRRRRPFLFTVASTRSSWSSLGCSTPSITSMAYKMPLSPQQMVWYSFLIGCSFLGMNIHTGQIHPVNQMLQVREWLCRQDLPLHCDFSLLSQYQCPATPTPDVLLLWFLLPRVLGIFSGTGSLLSWMPSNITQYLVISSAYPQEWRIKGKQRKVLQQLKN